MNWRRRLIELSVTGGLVFAACAAPAGQTADCDASSDACCDPNSAQCEAVQACEDTPSPQCCMQFYGSRTAAKCAIILNQENACMGGVADPGVDCCAILGDAGFPASEWVSLSACLAAPSPACCNQSTNQTLAVCHTIASEIADCGDAGVSASACCPLLEDGGYKDSGVDCADGG